MTDAFWTSLASVLIALFTLKRLSTVKERVDQAKETVEVVKEQSDGRWTAIHEELDAVRKELKDTLAALALAKTTVAVAKAGEVSAKEALKEEKAK